MDKRLTKRLIALILSGGILLSSTGVYTALAASEEYTTSEYTSALVGSDETVTNAPETTVPSTSESATSGTTEAKTTTEKETEAESTTVLAEKPATTVPSTTVKNETTTLPPFVEEETLVETPADNKATEPDWPGSGSEEDPWQINSAEELLGMNAKIAEYNNNKYFKLTGNVYLDPASINLDTHSNNGMPGSLVSVVAGDTSASNFFHLDGDGHTITFREETASDPREWSVNNHVALSIFGYVNSDSAIKNVVFDGIKITNSFGNAQAAGIILKNDGEIINCQFKNITLDTSSSTTTDDSFDVESERVYSGTACIVDNGSSGVIDNEITPEKTFAADRVTINTGRSYAGVLVAQNRGRIYKVRAKNITVHGNVTKSNCVGGLVGANLTQRSDNARGITFCEISKDTVKGGVKGADKIGYLVGYNTGRIHNSKVEGYFKSNVKATDSNFDILITGATAAGGIAGENIGDIQSCNAINIGVYFNDVVDGSIYGGIVGRTTYGIRNCVATGSTAGATAVVNNVKITAGDVTRYIGGIVGYVSDDENFSVDNCYALVKIIDSKAPLGAIVGFNGDNAYRNNRVRNVFYSSIISSRPSPVSYGKAGVGDLTLEKPYGFVNMSNPTIEVGNSNFNEISGWSSASFELLGNYDGDTTKTSYYSLTIKDDGIIYTLATNMQGQSDKTVINYDVKITLPVGADSDGTVLANEPMEFGILNLSAASVVPGEGTKGNPCKLAANADLNLLYHAPGAHFEVTIDLNAGLYSASPATFWGSVNFGGHQLTFGETCKPIFKGIYGSRSDSLSHNSIENHKSSPESDDPGNGVIQNLNITVPMNNTLSIPSLFGDICNATIKNTVVKLNSSVSVTLKEGDSGLFAKGIYGNTYMYGCYVDGATATVYADKDGISGFIGVIDAEKAIIDNCGANVVVKPNLASGVKKSAVFVSTIKSLKGGFIQNCYASGGLVKNIGEFDASSCNIFAGSIESHSSETNIWNCYYSPSHLYNNSTATGITSGIKSGSYTGTVKHWSFQRYDSNAKKYMDVTIKIVTAGDKDAVYVETLNNIDRFTNDISASSSVSSYFNTMSSNEEAFYISGFIRENSLVGEGYAVSVTLPESFSSSEKVDLYAEHIATGLVSKLSVTNSSALDIVNGSYVIKTPMDLYYLSVHQRDLEENSDKFKYLGASFILKPTDEDGEETDAIDMAGISIESIGDSSNPFTGTFDGNGKTIKNLSFNTESNADQALFGYVTGATIQNLTLESADIIGRTDTAALVGTVRDGATIKGCKVINSTIVGESHVGAIVGAVRQKDVESAKTVISGCTVEGTTVTSTKKERDFAYIGGIVGGIGASKEDTCYAEISSCKVTKYSIDDTTSVVTKISANGYGIGGIVGYASNPQNTIAGCTVEYANITCNGSNGVTYAALGGIAGLFGGSLIDTCTVNECEITGECASGVVGHLINETTVSTVSNCTVTGKTNIIAPDIAGGILAQISYFATHTCTGDKVINNCKIGKDVTVEALAAGGIVGNVQQFSSKNLTVSGSTNLGTIKTTGKKGSVTDAAGGIIGRLQSGQDTSGIKVTGCLSQGTIVGNSNLGGIIGLSNANAHAGAEKLIQNCYVTTAFSSSNLAVVKGLVIGFVGYATRNGSANLANEVIYSSLNNREPLFGNIEETSGAKDLNKGYDGVNGLLLDLPKTKYTDDTERNAYFPYYANAIVGYNPDTIGKINVVVLRTNMFVDSDEFYNKDESYEITYDGQTYETTLEGEGRRTKVLTDDLVPSFEVNNLPELEGFEYPAEGEPAFSTTASNTKILVGDPGVAYNSFDLVTIETFDEKCQATVKTTLTGTVNGESVSFDVGFTVIVDGNHVFEGKGTADDPYLIYTAEDLLSIKQHHDNPKDNDEFTDPYIEDPDTYTEYYSAHYMVMNDIDLTEELAGNSFAPIGDADAPFKGTIKTNGDVQYKISGLVINNPGKSENYAYSASYTKPDGTVVYSDALGLFGYTDGAKIYNLELENVQITSTPGPSNGEPGSVAYLGTRTGALVGVAVNTTIENVKVTGTSSINVEGTYQESSKSGIGGIIGKAGNNVVLTNVAFSGADNTSSGVRGAYYVGGIVGTSGNTTGCSITNAIVENAYVTNYANSGTSVAGGIAGQYAGSIVGVEGEETVIEEKEVLDSDGNPVTEQIETVVVVQHYAEVKNVVVTAMVAGGIVGTGNIDKSATGDTTYDLNIELAKVTRSEVKAHEVSAIDLSRAPNCVAGGILGKSCDSFGHRITDSAVDADTTVTSEFCAGGVVGRAENHGGLRGQRNNTLIITGCSTLAKVTQSYAGDFTTSSGKEVAGVGAVIGVIGAIDNNTNVMNGLTFEPQIQIKNVTAGGVVKGTYNVGGIVGQFASTQPNLHKLIDSLVYDCIVSAKIDTTAERAGIIFGSIEGNQEKKDMVVQEDDYEKKSAPFPLNETDGDMVEYASRIVDKVFYSSYMTGSLSLYGISAVNNYQGKAETAGKFSAAQSLSVYNDVNYGIYSSIYDVNKLRYNYPTGKYENNVEKRIEIPLSIVRVNNKDDGTAQVQYFGEEDYVFDKYFRDLLAAQGGGDITPFGFSIGEKDFVLAENGIHSKTGEVYDVLTNTGEEVENTQKYPYLIQYKKEVPIGQDDLVFTYTNGLEIGITVTAGAKVEGDGTAETPFEVPDATTLGIMVPILASNGTYHFRQTADIEFTEADLIIDITEFTGSYDGGGFSVTNYNLSTEASDSPVGMFGKVYGVHYKYECEYNEDGSVKTDDKGNPVYKLDSEGNKIIATDENGNQIIIPNVQNLKLIDCTVTTGDTSAGTGVVAGELTNGATISNVTVENCTVKNNVGNIGGAVGIVTGASKLENVTVSGTEVTTVKGSAGGVVGIMPDKTSTIIAPVVKNTTVTSGEIATNGETEVFNGGVAEDIAGGIVAQAYGTITGPVTTDANGNKDCLNAVEGVTVRALVSGGAVGAVYRTNTAETADERNLTLKDIRVADTDVFAKSKGNAAVASGAGLLGFVRSYPKSENEAYNITTSVELNNCYVDKNSTVEVVGLQAYGAGAVANVDNSNVEKLQFIDTEAYAEVSSSVDNATGFAYAASLVGYINNDPAILSFDGCVAGGKLIGTAVNTLVAGVIGGFGSDYATYAIGDRQFFINGVISAEVECVNGNKNGASIDFVHKKGKFIAGYGEEMFADAVISTLFANNYYSTHPQNIAFLANDSDRNNEFTAKDENGVAPFTDVSEGNLKISNNKESNWNSVAITKNLDQETTLYAKLNGAYAKLPYGSENNRRDAIIASNGFDLIETAKDSEGNPLSCIDFDKENDVQQAKDENGSPIEGMYEFKVTPRDYGAESFVAEYTCGLKTTAQIISVEILGKGTKTNPYLISTPTQLRVVAYLANGGFYFRQVNDIDLSKSYADGGSNTDEFIHNNSGKFYAPIGTESAPFDGVYDGQGYKIKGIKSNRGGEDGEDYVGVFGYVNRGDREETAIRNLHVELLVSSDEKKANQIGIAGKENVGGIAGYVHGAVIENCSVTNGAVTGQNNVGGIVGNFSDSKIINCFTQSDVNAFGSGKPVAGGIVGCVSSAMNFESTVSGCFASGSVYASTNDTTSDRSNAAGIVGCITNTSELVIDNCLFTGTTSSGYGIVGILNSTDEVIMTISDCIDAGQNVAMSNNEFTRIPTAVASVSVLGALDQEQKVNVFYDKSLLKVDTEAHPDSGTDNTATGVTGKITSELIGMSMGEGWNSLENHYPVPIVSEITVVEYKRDSENNLIGDDDDNATVEKTTENVTDVYSQAYAEFLSAPVYVDKNECSEILDSDGELNPDYGDGLVYPVTLLTEIGGATVNYSSSVFDTTDRGQYPEEFDKELYGIKTQEPQLDDEGNEVTDEEGNVVYEEVINKNTDLLFGAEKKDGELTGKTAVYRNIFDTTEKVGIREKALELVDINADYSKNTRVNDSAASGGVFANGEAYYNAQVPVVYATAEINGVTVCRDIKIPLSYGRAYSIATQRQLYALGGSETELEENDKFKNYYGSCNDYILITDMDCSDVTIPFSPIGMGEEFGYSGRFDGSEKTIKGLTIQPPEGSNLVGMFSMISKDYKNNSAVDPSVQNLTLENTTVDAKANQQGDNGNDVGTLVGLVGSGNVTIQNCKVIGEVIYEYDEETGEIKIDENGEPFVKEYKGSVTGGGSNVGGLIGRVEYAYSEFSNNPPKIIGCSSTVKVSGSKDAVGGLIGQSAGDIDSCYATGNVICDELPGGENKVYGVGGLIGIMTNGYVRESFASGNVEVKSFKIKEGNLQSGTIGVGGFVGYVAERTIYGAGGIVSVVPEEERDDNPAITNCFSGGNVKFGTEKEWYSNINANSSTAYTLFGIGGFSGINNDRITQVYSSAVVKSNFGTIEDEDGKYGVGIGGVAGIAFDNVKDVYSSGSVIHAYTSRPDYKEESYYNAGGTVGTDNAECTYCYFDSWTNNDPNLTSIGNKTEDNDKNFTKSYTTEALTKGEPPETGAFGGSAWGFTPNAYPYLKDLLNEEVDNYIKANAILSVVCVNVAKDDVSAKEQLGITQALTVPLTFAYKVDGETKTYNLLWTGATLEGNKAAINRTRNTQETVEILAQVEELKDYAIRTYSRACADMRGTFKQPYLIGRADDLAHMNMSQDVFEAAQSAFPEYYGQWATPIDGMGNPIDAEGNSTDADGNPITESGIVHYQLMSNVDVSTLTDGISDAAVSYTINGNTINYNGFMLNGNGYAIKNNDKEPKSTNGCFFENVNEKSTITNIIFEGLIFEEGSSAIVGTNNGTLQDIYVRANFSGGENVAGLVLENNSTIDGCVVDATITNSTENVGVMAVTNNGTITNSATAGTLETIGGTNSTASNIGAFVVNNNAITEEDGTIKNKGTIKNSFSMADIDVLSENAEHISGFVSVNDGGKIDSVYTRSAISFDSEPANKPLTIGLLVGEVKGITDAEHITKSYAAGLLGYFNEAQDSILFGTVGDMPKLSSVYVDKSLAGEKSVNSYKYSASLSSIMSMEYMQDMVHDGINVPEGFIPNPEKTVLPQHASIINSVNDRIVDDAGNVMYVDIENPGVTYTLVQKQEDVEDENGETRSVNVYKFITVEDGVENEYPAGPDNKSILYENGEVKVSKDNLKTKYAYYLEGEGKRIIRNFDVLKAYSEVSTMTIKTGQSQYIDRLIPNSKSSGVLNSTVSGAENIEFKTETDYTVIGFSGTTMSTGIAGKETVIAQYKKVDGVQGIKLLRELVINPQLRIDVAVSNAASRELNPNFSGGMGTKESPYIIKGAASLTSLHYYGTEKDLYFVLGEDIDMSGVNDFQIHHFTAHLNDPESTGGNTAQYTIENFTSTTGHGGLFGKIESGAVVNNVALTGKVIGNEQYTGALANIIEGKVTNCVVAADVTSTYIATETEGSATGVLAGRVTNGAEISNIVTTGRAVSTDTVVEEGTSKATNVAGGVIGSAQNAVMSNFLSTAYVETVENRVLAGGIVGEMVADVITDAEGEVTGQTTTLTNAIFGGFADGYAVDPNAENKVYNIYPIVAKQSVTEPGVVTITNTRFDKQTNNKTMVSGIVGTGLRTKECEKLVETTFKDTSFNNSLGNGFYPVPVTPTGSDSFNATVSLAAATMNFYIGSSSGEKGLYTSMQFVNSVLGYGIECKEIGGGNYFDIGVEAGQPYYSVKTKTYNEDIDPEPSIKLTLVKDKVSNGAVRIVVPGLARNANITYTIVNGSDLALTDSQLLGVLLKSVSENSANVLNDFTSASEIGKAQDGIVLAIAQGMDGFYVGEMLPSGYEFTVSGTVNGTITLDTTPVKDVYGTKVILPTIEPDEDGNVRTDVALTLTITKVNKPWGVNSIFNILWN